MTMDFLGGLPYTNGRATDAGPGTRRAGPYRRANAIEVAMKVAAVCPSGGVSPETSPDTEGQKRGGDAIPGAGIGPARPYGQGILSHSLHGSGPVQTAPYIVATGTSDGPDLDVTVPNGNRTSPDSSPEPRKRATPAQIAAANRSIAAHPERHRARVAVKDALRRGKLVKGPCVLADENCSPKITGHHRDYSEPLKVDWICTRHHRRLHAGHFATEHLSAAAQGLV